MSLFEFCRDFDFQQAPANTQAILKSSLLDIVAVMAGATSNDTSKAMRNYARQHYPDGMYTSRLIFDGQRVNILGAAWAGGFSADSLDAHEGHFKSKGHAGATVVPALLALTDALHHQGQQISGHDFLSALCIGYETALRAGTALMATSPTYHASGGFSAMGVVCAGARLLGFDEPTFRHALGIAEYFSARCPMMRVVLSPTMLRDAHGAGAYVGLNSLLMAQAGITGAPAETVEDPSVAAHWADIGKRWEIDSQYFKPWPVCRWAQPALTAMLEIQRQQPELNADVIESIRVETFYESMCLQGHTPRNADQAQYALAFPLAALIVRGKLGPDEVTGDSITAPDILSLSSRIEIVEASDISARFPDEILSRLTLTLKDGSVIVSPVTAAKGDPDTAMTADELDQKFDLFSLHLGRDRSRAVKYAIHSLDQSCSAITALDSVFSSALPPTEATD
ncbi:MmgE/PrpD protein [Pseudomonas amygdali pv. photiniae]|uniref:MmgE/PrpD family protein n=2 Tax=Pseudomonas amygdali TaxID=47877 RepID=A0A0P9T5G6_PSEA0|nr:MmgE/PrpD family protein [Pseudomonas amygdali]KPB66727.1 MmgE/PrpD family protein [Pseudomonas amygdali pv. myricae]KPX22186.1 MmgE/PrpD family protein [Pseudomonas amygdali pv. dendropanacis]KPX68644.1 MmgE/PrpD family protein [Pseudomonas amygdali pv. photiniae]KPX96540.1 MmgE/PrpD family protein [Pseudomonas amygdali pv. myricae]KWS43426.1 2-methylcitrate dehydratase [Pseudomonas amygdali pv. myricae]